MELHIVATSSDTTQDGRTDRRREGGREGALHSPSAPAEQRWGGGERGRGGGRASSGPPSAKCIPVNIRGVHLLPGSIPPAQPPLAPPASD
ncbi:hypothetical protein EYF80_030549 [Liparis tanakae]|uniref:Uncharacterized protein n=1 Tax=Liparis tanakae TaxID=230148 RepID=A0A4Z2H364_9TELE|nr:hypothetical protein EYF80_030549 [Liparis tanakae]